MARKSRNNKSVNVDLSGVETNRKAIPEGEYTVVVNSAEMTESQSGNPMIKFEFEVTEGKNKGAKLYENCSLQPNALFKLKSLLIGLGFSIPKKAFDLDLNELVGLTCDVEVGHEKYEGKTRARILTYIDPEDTGDEEDEEDGEDEPEGYDLESMSVNELKELAEALDLPKKKWSKLKKARELAEFIEENADEEDIIEALGNGDDDEDEEDGEDDTPDYESMSLKELKEEATSRGLKVKKGMDKEDLIEILEEDDED